MHHPPAVVSEQIAEVPRPPRGRQGRGQEILVRLLTHLGSFEGRSQFMTWAYTVAIRQLMRLKIPDDVYIEVSLTQ